MALLKVWTNRSARPFDEGWYGIVRICLTPLAFIKYAKSSEVNWGSLSDTNCSGNPYFENSTRRTSMVFGEVVVDISKTSGHLECASMHNNQKRLSKKWSSKINMDPFRGGCWPDPRVKWCDRWSGLGLLALQTRLTLVFNFFVESAPPNITSCHRLHPSNSWVVLMKRFQHFDCRLLGMITLIPHMRHPLSMLNSCCFDLYGLSTSAT